jgi:hypothetical protein
VAGAERGARDRHGLVGGGARLLVAALCVAHARDGAQAARDLGMARAVHLALDGQLALEEGRAVGAAAAVGDVAEERERVGHAQVVGAEASLEQRQRALAALAGTLEVAGVQVHPPDDDVELAFQRDVAAQPFERRGHARLERERVGVAGLAALEEVHEREPRARRDRVVVAGLGGPHRALERALGGGVVAARRLEAALHEQHLGLERTVLGLVRRLRERPHPFAAGRVAARLLEHADLGELGA